MRLDTRYCGIMELRFQDPGTQQAQAKQKRFSQQVAVAIVPGLCLLNH
jgi:hypothetical protein